MLNNFDINIKLHKVTRLDEVILLRCLATILAVAFHSICFYKIWNLFLGNHVVVGYEKCTRWQNFINMLLFVFLSDYVYSYA